MDTTGALARIQTAVTNQLLLSGSDEAVEAASRSLLAALSPTLRLTAAELAEQAAAEVQAQLPEHHVQVVLEGGEPTLTVRPRESEPPPSADADARLTLRLPPALKRAVEQAAAGAGESVNAWVVKALGSRVRRSPRVGRRVTGTVRT